MARFLPCRQRAKTLSHSVSLSGKRKKDWTPWATTAQALWREKSLRSVSWNWDVILFFFRQRWMLLYLLSLSLSLSLSLLFHSIFQTKGHKREDELKNSWKRRRKILDPVSFFFVHIFSLFSVFFLPLLSSFPLVFHFIYTHFSLNCLLSILRSFQYINAIR